MINATGEWVGIASLILFFIAYALLIFESHLSLRKSKPMVLFGCLMWCLIGIYHYLNGGDANDFINELVGEIGQLFFFLLVAMTYVNALTHLNVFDAIRSWLINKGLSFRSLFWAMGLLTFVLSPLMDNLTSALLMATIAQAVCRDKRFRVLSFINIVVAANAGGVWSPFGDITTLMVWTAGKVTFFEFLFLLLPSVINWLVPAIIMSFFVPKGYPEGGDLPVKLKEGAKTTIFLGILTIIIAVSFHNVLHLPPFLGMMLGLGMLMFASFFSKKLRSNTGDDRENSGEEALGFDVFKKVEKVEFDTLFFFFGVLTAVGALQYIGYLTLIGEKLYGNLGPTISNIIIGLVSAVGDNIPLMYSVLKIDPVMGVDQWLLITLAAGVGGSILSVGSAAGVAVMGVNSKDYTFIEHLKWSPLIILGYAASIASWWYITQHYLV